MTGHGWQFGHTNGTGGSGAEPREPPSARPAARGTPVPQWVAPRAPGRLPVSRNIAGVLRGSVQRCWWLGDRVQQLRRHLDRGQHLGRHLDRAQQLRRHLDVPIAPAPPRPRRQLRRHLDRAHQLRRDLDQA